MHALVTFPSCHVDENLFYFLPALDVHTGITETFLVFISYYNNISSHKGEFLILFNHLFLFCFVLILFGSHSVDNVQVSRLKDAMSQTYRQLEVSL